MLTRLALLTVPAIPGFGWLGATGAEQVASSGPDLQGIALIITSISGLIATIGALIIGLRKRPDTTAAELERLAEILRKQSEDR